MLQSKIGLIGWIFAAGCSVTFASGAAADDVIIKRFNRGDAAAAVGIADASEDVELYGPQALTSDGNATASPPDRSMLGSGNATVSLTGELVVFVNLY